MTVRLTETAITKAKKAASDGARRELVDAGCSGLRLRITPAGTATWVLACRDRYGRMRRFRVGSHPEMGISDARDDARALHTRVKYEGADPVAERRHERAIAQAARAGIGTLAGVLDTYGEKRGNTQRAWRESRKRIDLVFKSLLAQPVALLTLADLQLAADKYSFPKSAAFAVRTLRPALKWAAQPGRKYVTAELTDLSSPATVERRTRVLARAEMAALLPILRASNRPYAAALRFMLLTLTRRQEAAQATWCDVDWQAQTLTLHKTKNGEPHVVPLSHQAIELLQSLLSTDEAGRQQTRESGALIFATSTGASLGNWDRETKALQVASGTEGWTRHDLRRTGATMLGDMGVLPDIIEAALNHVSIRSPLAATYNRSRYRPQVADALQRLADALDRIEVGAPTVVRLSSRVAG
jgi:integrase